MSVTGRDLRDPFEVPLNSPDEEFDNPDAFRHRGDSINDTGSFLTDSYRYNPEKCDRSGGQYSEVPAGGYMSPAAGQELFNNSWKGSKGDAVREPRGVNSVGIPALPRINYSRPHAAGYR